MNADNPEVLRSGGSSGVAGISTFMSHSRVNGTQRSGTMHSVAAPKVIDLIHSDVPEHAQAALSVDNR
jgi:hypothetical protein